MELRDRPKASPDYLMQLMNDRKVMSSLPNFTGIFTHLERLLDEGTEQLHRKQEFQQFQVENVFYCFVAYCVPLT